MPKSNAIVTAKVQNASACANALFTAHTAYNKCCAGFLRLIFDAAAGKMPMLSDGTCLGHIGRDIVRVASDHQKNADYHLKALCSGNRINWADGKTAINHGATCVDEYQEHRYDFVLPSESSICGDKYISTFFIPAARMAIRQYKSWRESLKAARAATRKIKVERKKFDANNQDFIKNALPILQQWEKTISNTSIGHKLSWQRWALYHSKLMEMHNWDNNGDVLNKNGYNPDGGKRSFNNLIKNNPSIGVLHNLYSKYKSLWRTPPIASFSMPHPVSHPQWMCFSKVSPTTYRKLEFNQDGTGTIELRLDSDTWLPLKFRYDQRYRNMKMVDAKKKTWATIVDGIPYTIKSLKVRFSDTCNPSSGIYIDFVSEFEVPNSSRLFKKNQAPEKASFTSVDLGIRTPATIATATLNNGVLTFNNVTTCDGGMPDLRLIDHIDRTIKKKQRHSNRMRQGRKRVDGSITSSTRRNFCRGLYRRRNNLLRERANRIVNAVITAARNNMVDGYENYIIVEDLKSLLPDTDKSAFFNKRLTSMLRRKVVCLITYLANKYGIACFVRNPAGSSQVCSKCKHMGVRHNNYKFSQCAGQFACPNCNLDIDSDVNAAINLIKMTVYPDHLELWPGDHKQRVAMRKVIEQQILDRVRQQSSLVGA